MKGKCENGPNFVFVFPKIISDCWEAYWNKNIEETTESDTRPEYDSLYLSSWKKDKKYFWKTKKT